MLRSNRIHKHPQRKVDHEFLGVGCRGVPFGVSSVSMRLRVGDKNKN
jgi:hypothetical protein